MSDLIGPEGQFSAAYMAVRNLRSRAARDPSAVCGETLARLRRLLMEEEHGREALARLYYREAATVLACLLSPAEGPDQGNAALTVLHLVLRDGATRPRLAAAQALGSLAVDLSGPRPVLGAPGPLPARSFAEIAAAAGPDPALSLQGRSAVLSTPDPDAVLTLKVGGPGQEANLHAEARWMEVLGGMDFPCRFDRPRPLPLGAPFVFHLGDPAPGHGRTGPALAFLAHRDYHAYPNDPRPGRAVSDAQAADCLLRAARLFGHLASRGILHTAPIPLFHNRTQGYRRDDDGLYQWWRMGRLDRWHHSCLYPNFGLSGLRDFEHFEIRTRPGEGLFKRIGTQILSLLLTAGSVFRSRAPQRMGTAPDGGPTDARDLFDREGLRAMVEGVFRQYCAGFAGGESPLPLPLDAAGLAGRMIEEMGVDRHMGEIFRVQDQLSLTDGEFRAFLLDHGLEAGQAAALTRGAADIPLTTGPHLGGFNGTVSLPEIVEYAASAAACCVAGKFWRG